MGREINLEASNRLNLGDAVALSHSYSLVLKVAFEQRLNQVGDVAVMLDSVVEIADEAGHQGTVDHAASIQKVKSGFVVDPDLDVWLTIRRSELMATSPGENSAYGLPGGIYATVMCQERCPYFRHPVRRMVRSVHPIVWLESRRFGYSDGLMPSRQPLPLTQTVGVVGQIMAPIADLTVKKQ